ncbi:MAG TPA: hypothetical protein VG734_05305 [Lacunisphaera sp.]|nr:hypothetical protein [Lacunisphaera sp.]
MKTTRTASRPAPKSTKTGTSSLAGSASSTRRELAVLRRGRERLEEEPRVDETSARTGVAPRRISSP